MQRLIHDNSLSLRVDLRSVHPINNNVLVFYDLVAFARKREREKYNKSERERDRDGETEKERQ